MRRSIIILAAATAVASNAPASADEIRSASIAASVSDFATPEARATLDRRVQSATEEVCGANAVAEDVSWGSIKECRRQLRTDIYRKLSSLIRSTDATAGAR